MYGAAPLHAIGAAGAVLPPVDAVELADAVESCFYKSIIGTQNLPIDLNNSVTEGAKLHYPTCCEEIIG